MGLKVTLDINHRIVYLLLGVKLPDDLQTVIGLGAVAYLSAADPASVFLPAAVWHDAATKEGASIQETWPLWKVSDEFEKKMKSIILWEAENRPGLSEQEREELIYDLRLRAFELILIVDRYRKSYYEGKMI